MSRTALIYRVDQLPAVFAPRALYIVKTAGTDLYDLFLTSSDGLSAERIITDSDVAEMLNSRSNIAGGLARLDQNALVPLARIPNIPSEKIISTLSVNTTGNAATATRLAAPPSINGVVFDGSQSITINAVDITARIASSEKGAANGVATLDATGKVPSAQLPSFVDDIKEYASLDVFPVTGESDKIYVALNNGKIYRWGGTQYIEINSNVSQADSALKLNVARSFSMTGDGTWSVNFDGSQNVTANLVLANSGVAAGEYPVVSVNAKGLVVGGRSLSQADIPSLSGSKITSTLLVDTTGNAGSASKLKTARAINGVAFDGTEDITVSAVDTVTPRVATAEKGLAGGVATLDGTGKIPASQLPSFVDDVLEYTNQGSFPATGEAGKIYVSLDTGKTYRWSGSTYIVINNSVGSADTAVKLATLRSIAMTGDGAWSVNFDGSGNVSASMTLANTGVTAGDYPVVSVNAKGLVTSGRTLVAADIPSLPGSKINSTLSVGTTGNAATATRLATARTINGVNFDGSGNITINAVDATARIAASEKGAANGVATLDANGQVPSSQLPSYVDDILEYAALANFPVTGESGKIYVALDSGKIYRWTGSAYIAVNSSVSSADTAVKLAVARTITITGDLSGSFQFDGSQNISGPMTLVNSGVTAGEYPVVTVNAKGLITSGRALAAGDIPNLPGSKITSALTVDTSGNAGTATKLQTARAINGVNFDGTSAITIPAVDTVTPRVPWSSVGAPNGVASLTPEGRILQVPDGIDGQTTGLKSNGDYVWKDLMAPLVIRDNNGSGNNPSFGSVIGNLQGLIFSAGTMQQVWVDFLIPHDYAMGTDVYPSLHWMPLTNGSGGVVWGVEYSIAKKDGFFSSTLTSLSLTQSVASNSLNKHTVAEFPAIPATLLEPDCVIKMRVFRNATVAADSYSGTVHAWQITLHYQVGQIGTRGRESNYFA